MKFIEPEELLDQQVSFVGRVSHLIWSKNNPITPGTFCIFSFEIEEILEGELPYGWTVGSIVTCKGEAPSLRYGSPYKIIAELTESKYGYQYDVLSMNTSFNLSSIEDQKNFFSYVLTENEIKLLFSTYDNPLQLLIDKDIEKLTAIKGIGIAKANGIIEKFEQNKDKGIAYAKLKKYDLTKNAINKLIKKYKFPEVVVEKIKEDPYILIEEVDGFGWKKCDAIAAKAGIGENEESRIRAFVKYFLTTEAESEGNTWVDLDYLADNIFNEAPQLSEDECIRILKTMTEESQLWYDRENNRIALKKYRDLEEKIAEELIRINNGPNEDYGDAEKIIAEAEFEVGYEYTEEQKNAIRTILSNKVVLLSAKAGSGKSSSMFPIARVALQKNKEIEICALSGKASLNLASITGIEGKTIHRLLKYNPEMENFIHHRYNPLQVDIVILDELSMVGGEIFYSLLQAIPDTAKLIMLGDENQLESIGLCNLLKDIKNSGVITTITLNKILRQAAKSGILHDSFKICDSEQFIPATFTGEETHGELHDFKIQAAEDGRTCAVLALEEYKRLVFNSKVPITDINIATCKRSVGETSARVMNSYIQNLVNPLDNHKNNLSCFYKEGNMSYEINYREGDRVLVTKNSYETPSTDGTQKIDIFNGNLGTIKWIVPEQKIMGVEFPAGEVLLTEENFKNLQLGYAVTCHKLQGSTIPYVIALCTNESYILNSKEMLYTQITRAKKYCCLIGQTSAIRNSVKTSRVKKKQTFLTEILQEKTANG